MSDDDDDDDDEDDDDGDDDNDDNDDNDDDVVHTQLIVLFLSFVFSINCKFFIL